MSTPLRGAIIGFGNVAERGHLPAWLARDDMEIVAVAEPDPARRARAGELLPAARLHDDPDELFREAAALDFVDIATPPALHAPLIVAAAAAGLHVVCEKPLVVSVSEYHRVRDAVREAGVVLFTVHNWKYSEPFQRVRALLDADSIGPLRSIMLETIRDGCARSARVDWRMSAGLAGGGILVDHGWHGFYIMLGLARQRPRAVRAELARRRYFTADVEDSAECTVVFPTVTGRLVLTWAGSERRTRWLLEGRDGVIEVDDDRISVRRGERVESFVCSESLSDGSHHPEWFGRVLEAFRRELVDPAVRGENLSEAGQCIQLLSLAYTSHANAAPAPLVPAAAG